MIVSHSSPIAELIDGIIERRRKRKLRAEPKPHRPALPTPKDSSQTSFPTLTPANDNMGRLTKAQARVDLAGLVQTYTYIPSQMELAMRWGRPKGTVSKWLKSFEGESLIRRQFTDRRKAVYRH
jgi:hypothetical protein